MLRKFMLHLVHDSNICLKICSKKYPWGWKSKESLVNYKKLLYSQNKKIKTENEFNVDDFLSNSIFAYNLIYKSYIDNVDFLDYQYTNPSLSIALNNLRDYTCYESLNRLPREINVTKYKILSNKIKNEVTTNNFKFLGYYDNLEISHELSAGAIGPEVRYIWDQKPVKQVINVLYKSDDFYDIIEWERDLAEEDPDWQVSNINKII